MEFPHLPGHQLATLPPFQELSVDLPCANFFYILCRRLDWTLGYQDHYLIWMLTKVFRLIVLCRFWELHIWNHKFSYESRHLHSLKFNSWMNSCQRPESWVHELGKRNHIPACFARRARKPAWGSAMRIDDLVCGSHRAWWPIRHHYQAWSCCAASALVTQAQTPSFITWGQAMLGHWSQHHLRL